ncbi:MAG: universal stress protein [Caldilineaceae bacterium]|nr:universal stress protein [Caldilineaceae bacterium]
MFEKIVAPLDGSAFAASVIPHIVAMAQATSAQVTLLRVMVRDASMAVAVNPLDWQLQKTEAQTYLDEMRNRLTQLLSTQPKTVVLEGRAADRIIEYAQQSQCDLVALSSHGQSGLHAWNVSSIAQKVINRVGKSFLLVRAYQMATTGQVTEWEGVRYRRIVVPLDGAPRSEHVLPIATNLAEWHGAELVLVHVVTRPTMIQRMPLTAEESALAEQLFERNQSQAHKYLEQLRQRLAPAPQIHVITGENISSALHKFITQHEGDLLIMSAHGQSAQRQWPYGSLVSSLIDQGTTSLLVLQDMAASAIEPTAAEQAADALRRQPPRPTGGNEHPGPSTGHNTGIQVDDYAATAI